MMDFESPLGITGATKGAVSPAAAIVGMALCFAAVAAIFWPTTWSMVDIWWRFESYQHCFVVIPITLWLVWRERARLAASSATPFWPGLLLVVILGAVWLLGVLASAQSISQFAMVGLMGAVVLSVFGLRWTQLLWFPLLFLLFAVPTGEMLIPKLMDWTADSTVAALRLTGVPVYREGNHFVIPSGHWSVIEACSGVKFLTASLMVGTLYSWLMYRSNLRRSAFIIASIVVPIVANWLRAYLIVLIAHLTNNRWMLGPEHFAFGWLLFGLVMFALFWAGARWREDGLASPVPTPDVSSGARSDPRQLGMAALVSLAILAAWPPLANSLLLPVGEAGALKITAPAPLADWQAVAEPIAGDWMPAVAGAAATRTFTFRRGEDRVGLFVAAFRYQHQAEQLATAANQIVASRDAHWILTSRDMVDPQEEGRVAPPQVRASTLRRLGSSEQLMAWQWYWIAGTATSSDARGKLELALSRLLRRSDTGLWVAVYTPLDQDDAAAERALRAFLRDMASSLHEAFIETTAP